MQGTVTPSFTDRGYQANTNVGQLFSTLDTHGAGVGETQSWSTGPVKKQWPW